MTTIKARKPTGAVPWPLVLVEGPEKTGKSWALAEFTGSKRVGQSYWLDLGEGAADEYAAIEGADYLVLDHDGTWRDIHGQVAAVRQEAQRAHDAGEKPVVLLIDSMSAEWDMLKDWVGSRARQSNYAKKQLKEDPDAEIKPAMNLWNDANDRHNRLMHMLMTFPGIVVVTARGKMVASLDKNGRPIPNEKEYKVEGHKNLAFDVSAWVRLSRDEAPKIVGIRSVNHGLRPGVDKPKPAPQFTLDWLIFDALQCDPATAKVRDLQALDSTADPAPEQASQQSQSAADRFSGRQQSNAPQVTAAGLVESARAAESIKALGELWGQVKALPESEREAVYNLIRELKTDMTALAESQAAS